MGGSTEESTEAEKSGEPEEPDDAADDISPETEKLLAETLFNDLMAKSGLEGEARTAFEPQARAKATKQIADTLAHGSAKRRRRGL